MSHKGTKIKITNNLSTSKGRSVSRRSTRVFGDARDPSVQESVFLYRLVFNTRKAVLLSVFLLLCFVAQPFQRVHADNETADIIPASSQVEIPPEFSQEVVKAEVISETPSQSTDSTDTEVAPNPSVEDDSYPSKENLTRSSATENNVISNEISSFVNSTSTPNLQQGISAVDIASTTLDIEAESGNVISEESVDSATTTASSTLLSNDDNGLKSDNVSTSTEVHTENDLVSDENESSLLDDDEVTTNNDNLVSIVESDSQFSFLKSECTRIEDGSFYCQKKSDSVSAKDSLVAAPDADGDLEIFLVRAGERTQITHNKVDDASPYYDEYSKTIVWHRLINDRYQIISYDTETGKEEQLTDTNVNNMEPTRHGDYTVWQRWVDNNWEIVLFDGNKEKQITSSSRHDIAPHVRGPLIIWNSRSNDGTQSLMTYDIQDRTYTTIADGEGVSVSNPRLMVMYEAMYENGDVVMKGFDVVTGKIVPLQSLPTDLPSDLPNTDSTGETRALIQNKPNPKQSDVVNSKNGSLSGSSTPPVSPELEDFGVLDLRATSTVEIVGVDLILDSPTSTIPDLVIPIATSTLDSTSSSQTVAE